jgi:hypothetical protein
LFLPDLPSRTYKAARPPIKPIAPRTNGATVFRAAHALLVEDAAAVPLLLEVPDVILGLVPPMRLAETPVLLEQCEE